MKCFSQSFLIHLGRVVSDLAFHAGGPPSSPSPTVAITKPLKSLKLSPLKALLREKECQL